jgi:diguanylate cyclase (GGDEF)-like protein
VACEPVELLPINWKMIKRLQWLYPPTAQKFMHNLLTILCSRVERLTHCLADAKSVDDVTGLRNRESFTDVLTKEIQRARRYQSPLSLGLIKVEFENAPGLDLWQRETLMQSIGEALRRNVRGCDTVGRCDPQLFGLLLPQTALEEARMISRRLDFLLRYNHEITDGGRLKIVTGLSQYSPADHETAPALLERAAGRLAQAVQAS